MPDKIFTFEGRALTLKDPASLKFDNAFYEKVYTKLFGIVTLKTVQPFIDFDSFTNGKAGIDVAALANKHAVKTEAKTKSTSKEKTNKAMQAFLNKYPYFYNFISNMSVNASINMGAVEWLLGAKLDSGNFVAAKKLIDDFNRIRWTRRQDVSESQSGVSVLGNISEGLLKKALESFIDNVNFFENTTSAVESYGDFVLMSMPNNLWISVKSNFARERLLASGFMTDILGVGFFTDATEFTSGYRVRNFQKVGFIAMYLPDIPITEDQVRAGSSTYSEVMAYYAANQPEPVNINGTPFIRKLSELRNDLAGLLAIKDVRRRVTVTF